MQIGILLGLLQDSIGSKDVRYIHQMNILLDDCLRNNYRGEIIAVNVQVEIKGFSFQAAVCTDYSIHARVKL